MAFRPPLKIPDGLAWWAKTPEGAQWLRDLPHLVEACRELWGLELGPPWEPATVSLVLPAGEHAVLKLNFPDEESRHEGLALRHWQEHGAVRLLAESQELRALLLERCHPGTPLWEESDDEAATRLAAEALRNLWRSPPPPPQVSRLAAQAQRWLQELPADYAALGQPFESSLLDVACGALRELGPRQGEQVLLHQDFHGGNLLREGDGWRVIDPKPLAGEREFDAASLLRDRRRRLTGPDGPAVVRRRLDLLAELGLDRERMRGWAIVHALAWGVSGHKVEPDMVHAARLLRDAP